MAIGAFLLGMETPENYALHDILVEAILDVFVCLEAVMLVRNAMSEIGGNDNLLRDLLMILADTLITVYQFVDYLGKTHSPWDVHTMLHLVGSSLAVIIGLGQIIQILYKAYTNHVFGVVEEQDAGAARDGNEGADVEEQMVGEGADVMVVVRAWLSAFLLLLQLAAPRVFMRELEMALGAAIRDNGGGDDAEEVARDEGFEVVVVVA
ncbi:uncharacterized protein [Aegilops tauschii subsp. strangulata]|uniref:uncharacterized protein isoform X1 n=1 Tax=Aegilops tauschii subsp. strangulata TaxID=200361 RepID=UPI00098B18AC|nr:uncharacterized protein LOC109787323 isoform X1 [Aegilops tauschii subsp. strangulata]